MTQITSLTSKEKQAREKLCLALDVPKVDAALRLVENLREHIGMFKIGSQFFTSDPKNVQKLIDTINGYGCKTFLDLKFHDIPNTVRKASKAAAELGVHMFTVHASGGSEMMQAAREGALDGRNKIGLPKVIAVTVLTSLDNRKLSEELFTRKKVDELVRSYAIMASHEGLDGIVCSGQELNHIKYNSEVAASGWSAPSEIRPNFMYVTAGIQTPGGAIGRDQNRIFTPANAIRDGADVLVVGRTVTTVDGEILATPDQMRQTAQKIIADMARVL